MIQGSNSMMQSVGADDKAKQGEGGQDVMQKFMLMKLMETMGKGNQPRMPQYQEQPEVVPEEEPKEESESESEDSDDEMPDMTGNVQITSPDQSPDASPMA